MPSDSKKKRDLQKKAAAKQRQGGKKTTTNNAGGNNDPIDDDLIDDNDENEEQNENKTPVNETNGTTIDADPNIKSVIQNLDLLSMVEKANAAARSSTGKKHR